MDVDWLEAIFSGPTDVEALLASGAHPDATVDGEPLLTLAVRSCFSPKTWPTIELLVRGGASLTATSANGRTPLHEVAFVGNLVHSPNATRLFCSHGANVHASDKRGLTALHLAVTTLCVEEVAALLEHGADPSALDINGDTPLHRMVATFKPDPEDYLAFIHRGMVDLLLPAGADTTLTNGAGLTVAELAATTKGYPPTLVERLATPR